MISKSPFLSAAGTLEMQFSAKQKSMFFIIVTNTGSTIKVPVQLTHNTLIDTAPETRN